MTGMGAGASVSVLPLTAIAASAGLMYVLGARVFTSAALGALAAGLFLASPALWTQLQSSPASLYPLPVVVAWLVAVTFASGTRATLWCALAGLALGVGLYTTPAAVVMMPLYLLLTIAVFAYARTLTLSQLGVIVLAFALAAVPRAALLWGTGEFRDVVTVLRLYDADRFNLLQGIREIVSWVGLTARSQTYYDYFNPAFLFLTGGVLFLPMLVLIPIGLYRLLDEGTAIGRLSLAGFLVAPTAAALTAETPIARRILFLTPFAAIVSAYGLQRLMSAMRSVRARRVRAS